jgi:ArsR family transcriptional regulator
MIPPSTEITNLHAQLCSAIADPTRILVLYALAEQPQNVTELVEILTLPQSTISRHLAVLRGAGLVIPERNGRQVHYALADLRVIQALDLMRSILADRVNKHADLLNPTALSSPME